MRWLAGIAAVTATVGITAVPAAAERKAAFGVDPTDTLVTAVGIADAYGFLSTDDSPERVGIDLGTAGIEGFTSIEVDQCAA